jgi:hypothetical protein
MAIALTVNLDISGEGSYAVFDHADFYTPHQRSRKYHVPDTDNYRKQDNGRPSRVTPDVAPS